MELDVAIGSGVQFGARDGSRVEENAAAEATVEQDAGINALVELHRRRHAVTAGYGAPPGVVAGGAGMTSAGELLSPTSEICFGSIGPPTAFLATSTPGGG